jgi:hypothetical protein
VFGVPDALPKVLREPLSDASIWAEVGRLAGEGRSRREAIAELATREGRTSKDVYAAAERGKTAAGSPAEGPE